MEFERLDAQDPTYVEYRKKINKRGWGMSYDTAPYFRREYRQELVVSYELDALQIYKVRTFYCILVQTILIILPL